MPTTHTLRISLGFPESLAINASASKVEFHLHERARAIVSYLQSSWGERWIANLFHGIIRGTASRCAGVEPLMVDIGAPPAPHFTRAHFLRAALADLLDRAQPLLRIAGVDRRAHDAVRAAADKLLHEIPLRIAHTLTHPVPTDH